MYNGILQDAKVCDVKSYETDVSDSEVLKITYDEMRTKAAEEIQLE